MQELNEYQFLPPPPPLHPLLGPCVRHPVGNYSNCNLFGFCSALVKFLFRVFVRLILL